MSSDKQIQANRENAKLSTGPVTPEGRATSSHNAVKTGLTGQTVLLKTDDVASYNKHVQRFTDQCQPDNDNERTLVQDLADTEWRLLRITPLEAGIYALGRIELAPLFASETDEAVRAQLLEAKVFLVYRRDLSNLSLQQTRLRRHRELVTAELSSLQYKRKMATQQQVQRAADYYCSCLDDPDWPFNPTDLGFEFSLDQMFLKVAFMQASEDGDEYPEVTVPGRAAELKAEYAASMSAAGTL